MTEEVLPQVLALKGEDIEALKDCGVATVFGPGTNITKAALEVIDMIQ